MTVEKVKLSAVIVTVLVLSVSCAAEVDQLGCWVTMEEVGSNQVKVRARLEDTSTGNTPTGASVLLKSPAREVSWLNYVSSSNMYETTLTAALSGNYIVSVSSSLGDDDVVIPFVSLTETPTIVTLQDASGTVAGTGQALNPATAISVE